MVSMSQDPQWMPETADGTEPCVLHVFLRSPAVSPHNTSDVFDAQVLLCITALMLWWNKGYLTQAGKAKMAGLITSVATKWLTGEWHVQGGYNW